MYDCYNEALKYLISKYGEKVTSIGTHYQGQKNTTKKVVTYCTDKEMTHEDKEVSLLLGQYYLGIEPKKELYNIMLSKGLVKEME